MKVAGIAAEYNPFHKGHKYHLAMVKKATGADYRIVALSGNFCQRGVPAFFDKMTRTRMALFEGADMVVEIPVPYATSSAEGYALGSVGTLDCLGIINNMCFGMESKYTEELEIAASKIRNAKETSKDLINDCFKDGKSYAGAMSEIVGDDDIMTPNNILGIEYINAIYRLGSNMSPFGITRLGSYASDKLANDSDTFSSASAVRKALSEEGLKGCKEHIPENAFNIMKESFEKKGPSCQDDFSNELYHMLKLKSKTGFEDILGIDRSLSDRITNLIPQYNGYEDFTALVKTRNVTHSHVSRAMLHILLDIRKDSYKELSSKKHLPYVHVLGFKDESSGLLKEIKENAKCPVIYKAEDTKLLSDPEDINLLNIDLISADIYNGKIKQKYGVEIKSDFASPVLKI